MYHLKNHHTTLKDGHSLKRALPNINGPHLPATNNEVLEIPQNGGRGSKTIITKHLLANAVCR